MSLIRLTFITLCRSQGEQGGMARPHAASCCTALGTYCARQRWCATNQDGELPAVPGCLVGLGQGLILSFASVPLVANNAQRASILFVCLHCLTHHLTHLHPTSQVHAAIGIHPLLELKPGLCGSPAGRVHSIMLTAHSSHMHVPYGCCMIVHRGTGGATCPAWPATPPPPGAAGGLHYR